MHITAIVGSGHDISAHRTSTTTSQPPWQDIAGIYTLTLCELCNTQRYTMHDAVRQDPCTSAHSCHSQHLHSQSVSVHISIRRTPEKNAPPCTGEIRKRRVPTDVRAAANSCAETLARRSGVWCRSYAQCKARFWSRKSNGLRGFG